MYIMYNVLYMYIMYNVFNMQSGVVCGKPWGHNCILAHYRKLLL